MFVIKNHSAQSYKSIAGLVEQLIRDAIHASASDIHFEQEPTGLRIRYRIDGVLYDQPSLDAALIQQIISRLKICAQIDIAQKRLPQDGKFSIMHNHHEIDLRVSTFPAVHGEKVVIRILDRTQHMIALNQLGMHATMCAQFTQLIDRPTGFILVTGPTGSGKTTTLYAALNRLNSSEKNIVTLEDPVEYNLPGITQGQISPETGFTFERGIRHLLRQDPDIAMIGEIRDKESARIGIEAALTGHLVLSTLHTNDAPSAIMRLMDMRIEPFLINASITGILAQRLVRMICSSCKIEYAPDQDERAQLHRYGIALERLYKGRGCVACNQLGYKGRTGIFELLHMSNALRALIVQQPNFDQIIAQTQRDGMQTLLADGFDKVAVGIITLQELLRVIC